MALFSIHIPKCTGTSLRRVLKEWFGQRFYFHHANAETNEKPTRFDLSLEVTRRQRWLLRQPYHARVCVHGHFNHARKYGVLDYYPDACQFITLLREPFDIPLSIYFFSKGQGAAHFIDGKQRQMRNEFLNLEDYLTREVLNKPSIIPEFMPFPLSAINFERELNKRFVYVGLTEDSDKSMERLAQRLGYPFGAIPRVNQSNWDEPVPPGARAEHRQEHLVEYAPCDYDRAHYVD